MSQKTPKKRINLVHIQVVKEKSVMYGQRKLDTAEKAAQLAKILIQTSDREKVIVCCVDTKCQPTSLEVVSMGSINAAVVHPREVFKNAILSNSYGIFLFHNHVSGDCFPSEEDKQLTRRLAEAGELLGIKVLDHIIISSIDDSYQSFTELVLL